MIDVKVHGGGNGIDDDAALALSLFLANPGEKIMWPKGQYRFDTQLNVPTAYGNGNVGEGPENSVITVNSPSNSGIVYGGGAGLSLENIQIKRNVQAVAGYGFDFPVLCGQSSVVNVRTRGHFVGAGFSSTDFSIVNRLYSEFNWSHGILMRPNAQAGSLQWNLNQVLTQMNNGAGVFIQALALGPTHVAMGTWENFNTFANNQNGVKAVGLPSVPITGLRIKNSFLGADGASEIFLDTYGSMHCFDGVYCELAGTSPTGRGPLGTAKTNQGSGIQISANNKIVSVANCALTGNSWDGILTQAEDLMMVNPLAVNNGVAQFAGRRNGIYVLGGKTSIVGGYAGNTNASLYQQYGVIAGIGTKGRIVGMDFDTNTIAPHSVPANWIISASGAL